MRNTVLVLGMCLLTGSTFLSAQQRAQLDTTTFVVLGEGLAAGMANYGLSEAVQDKSFPAQMARQMETAFPQPLMQAPGIGDVLGYPPLPVRLPAYPQNRVRIFPPRSNKADEAPTLFVFNLSIPNLKVHESLTRRPMLPLIHENDAQQTLINMILGFPSLLLQRDVPLWTQFEYAVAMFPTFALLELGYSDVLEAAVHGDPNRIPDAGAFRSSYARVVEGLRDLQAQVLVTTIPDPLDTGYFLSPERAAELMGTSAHLIQSQYDLATEDRITRNGLTAIGNQMIRGKVEPLPDRSVL